MADRDYSPSRKQNIPTKTKPKSPPTMRPQPEEGDQQRKKDHHHHCPSGLAAEPANSSSSPLFLLDTAYDNSMPDNDSLHHSSDQISLQQQQHDDKGICSACCDSPSEVSVKSDCSHSHSDSQTGTPTGQALHCLNDTTDRPDTARHAENSLITVEYISLPGSPEDEELPGLEVGAVLVELSSSTLSEVNQPPPPYTLVRGRRMRFLQQQMHLPASGQQRYLTADLYRLQQQSSSNSPEDGKGCCRGMQLLLPESLNVRWFIIVISFIALCCVVVGIVLGALKGANEFTGDDSLTIALLLIGVGIILIAVSGAAWKLTAKQGSATSLRTMLGFGSLRATSPPLRSFRRSSTGPFSTYLLRNSFGRGCLVGHYHEFQFRPPPPSYHASMSDFGHGVRTLLDRTQSTAHNRTPPPVYRPRVEAHTTPPAANPLPLLNQLNMGVQQEEYHHSHQLSQPQRSAPPSYRFRPASAVNEERASLGRINAMFNENHSHSTGERYCGESDGVVSADSRPQRRQPGSVVDGQSTSARRAAAPHADLSSTPKNSHNRNMELLAQL